MTTDAVTRSSILAELLELVPIQRSSGLRLLEIGTDPDAGTSAAELADLSGGLVVSLSRSSQIIAKARAASSDNPRLSFHRQLPLGAGYPAGQPYDLVLSWELMDYLPQAWLSQCTPGGRILSPVFVHEPATIGLVRVSVDQARTPHHPAVAFVKSGGGTGGRIVWDVRAAALKAMDGGYIVQATAEHHQHD